MRKHNTSIFAFSAFGLSLISHFAYTAGDRSTASGFFYIDTVLLPLFVSQVHPKTAISGGRRWWSHKGARIIMNTPESLIRWELGTLFLAACSCVVGVLVWLVRSRGEWIAPAGPATIGTAALSYATPIIRAGGPNRRRIALSEHGVEFTWIDGRTDTIPWSARPHLVGVSQGKAVIASKKNQTLSYSIGYLPLSLRQLDRLLRTLSTNARLRADLAKTKALSTVLTILEPTPDELTDGSWTWRRREPRRREPRESHHEPRGWSLTQRPPIHRRRPRSSDGGRRRGQHAQEADGMRRRDRHAERERAGERPLRSPCARRASPAPGSPCRRGSASESPGLRRSTAARSP